MKYKAVHFDNDAIMAEYKKIVLDPKRVHLLPGMGILNSIRSEIATTWLRWIIDIAPAHKRGRYIQGAHSIVLNIMRDEVLHVLKQEGCIEVVEEPEKQ